MSLFTQLPKPARYLLAGALALGFMALLKPTPLDLRGPLLEIRDDYKRALGNAEQNMRNQFTPGFKKRSQWGGPANLVWTQGEIFKTQTPTNLAINGQGCFGVRAEGRSAYTRDGRFSFRDGILQSQDGWQLQGMALDRQGNITAEPGPIKLALEPNTNLYGGRFTGFHFDETGKMFGEQTSTDPVTGQANTSLEPLYQVVLYQFPNPAGLENVLCPGQNFWSETSLSGKPLAGIAGQGALGGVCPASLELSNVDFMSEGISMNWVGQHLKAYGTQTPSQLEAELRQRMRSDSSLRRAALENLRGQLTPGYRSWDLLGSMQNGELRLRLGQGRPFETGNPMDLALNGDGYLVLESGELTRNGHLTWSEQGLRSGGLLVMGYRPGSQKLEPVLLPATASNLEITLRGEVRWTEFNGDGRPVEGYRLALARPLDPRKLRRSGANLRADCDYGVAGPAFGTSLEQGKLESSDLDPYEERLLAAALLELAGLPPFDLRQPDAGHRALPQLAF